MQLKTILNRIEKEVEEREDAKEKLYEAMRMATRLSKRAIFSVHKGRFEEAKKTLREAKTLFAKLHDIPETHQRLVYAGIVDAAFQEYTEAQVFLKLAEDGSFVGPEEIGAPATSYLLGLADVVGELRRRALDSLREGDAEEAEKSLEMMELIYDELVGMDKAMHTVSELRRKCDVARRIVEATRGDVTIEVRRDSLERSILRLEKTLKTERK